MGLAALGLVWAGAVVWAKQGDRFERERVWLPDGSGGEMEVWLVRPREFSFRLPRVVYVSLPGTGWQVWGRHAVQLASVGAEVAVVTMGQTGGGEVGSGLGVLRRWMVERSGGTNAGLVWVAWGGAAPEVVRFLAREGWADGWVWVEMGPDFRLGMAGADPGLEGKWGSLGCGEWVADVTAVVLGGLQMEEVLRELTGKGACVRGTWVARVAREGPDQEDLTFRVAGEGCLRLWGGGDGPPTGGMLREKPAWWPWWVAWGLGWIGLAGWAGWRRWCVVGREVPGPGSGSTVLRTGYLERVAWVVRGVTLGLAGLLGLWHGFHVWLWSRPAEDRTLGLVRARLVMREDRSDFEELLKRVDWRGRPWRVWLEHAHLASYNRRLVNWAVPDEEYVRWVLNPRLDESDSGAGEWRRWLWERLYPRVRREVAIKRAVGMVTGYLRSRVGVAPWGEGEDLERMWRLGWATEAGFAKLCVAGLRSVGIPARVRGLGEAEYWDGVDWREVEPVVAEVGEREARPVGDRIEELDRRVGGKRPGRRGRMAAGGMSAGRRLVFAGV